MLAAQSKLPLQKDSQSSLAWKQVAEGVDSFLNAVDDGLKAQVREFEPEIAACAEYALSVQGKHLRPILVAHSANACGKQRDEHVTVAVIIEMVHLATLVHDDVIDEATIRRGRPTLAAKWGNEISVLLGDCLFAQALKLASTFPTPEICRAVSSATNTVCSGEILQMQQRANFQISREQYFRVLAMKTAELFALSCDLGAYISDSTLEQRQLLRRYGMELGTAYQVYDDCLDLFGSEAAAGKSLGTDLAKGKLTLPLLIALERASQLDRDLLQRMIQGWNPAFLPNVFQLMDKYETLHESKCIIDGYLAAARQSALELPRSESRDRLVSLTEYLDRQVGLLESAAG